MHETSKRTLTKALTWQLLGLVVMTAVGYAVTGSALEAGALSLGLQAFSLVCYIAHERVWGRIRWGLLSELGAGRCT